MIIVDKYIYLNKSVNLTQRLYESLQTFFFSTVSNTKSNKLLRINIVFENVFRSEIENVS